MGQLTEYKCTYGSGKTKSKVLCYENSYSGKTWYVVKGGCIVNLTYESLYDGIDVERIGDIDCFTSNKPINTLGQLERVVES